ncbi:enoyl-CoA hydratase-related protein [Dehalogenimonas sp. THU2]|uniref:enoyl-CoA hydratase/isomerase family protein n=1 Tax=Dehalogenimonas sp. THU2 TaxID=3151121 RepID=UPI0032183090
MTIDYKTEGPVAIITLNRPEVYNAMDMDSVRSLAEAVERFEADIELKVAIITGTGKAFCAGADIRETLPYMKEHGMDNFPALPTRGMTVTKPLIAAVNGIALGGGLELALACDIRIAAANAKFGLPEVNLGLIPGWGGTQRLPRLIGSGRAAEMLFTGQPVNAEQAERIGLVNKVVPGDELMTAALDMARVIAEKAPLAVRYAKEALRRGENLPLELALDVEAELEDTVMQTADHDEGVKAFLEKRTPEFEGR